jgi:protein-tyrosine phosphatase
MIDLHAHLLPGVDDGPPDLPSALALAAAAVAEGTRVMAATPHIGYTHGIDPRALAGRADALRAALADAGIPLEVAAGGELAPDRALDLSEDELRAIALGGSRCLLLECPFTRAGGLMPRLVAHLQAKGMRVLLAHPERSPAFLDDADALRALVERGAFAQLTAGSLGGVFGSTVRRASRTFLEQGLVHCVASDAHTASGGRSPALAVPVAAALDGWGQEPELTRWLCHDAPRALLDDSELPPRPDWRRRRRLRLTFRAR